MKAFIVLSLLTISLPAMADPATDTEAEAVSQPVIENVEEEEVQLQRPAFVRGRPRAYGPTLLSRPPLKPRYFGMHVALPGTFALDLQAGHFYMYMSAGIGVALFSDFDFAGATLGAGYTMPIRRTHRGEWKMDIMGVVGGGRQYDVRSNRFYGFYGGGVALGFRYEHGSGFSLGFKIPIFGYEGGRHIRNTRVGLGLWYLNALASMPIVSVGYRF